MKFRRSSKDSTFAAVSFVPKLRFQVDRARAVTFAASPQLALSVSISNDAPSETVHSIMLASQVWIETPERTYTPSEAARLADLFGEPDRWERTLRRVIWTTASVVVPAFSIETNVDLPLPCPHDFESTTTQYLFALENGEVPITLQFSGSAFYRADDDALQVAPIPWSSEAKFRVPLSVYRETIDHYYPNRAPLSLRRDVLDRLRRYKVERHIATWEEAVERLLAAEERP